MSKTVPNYPAIKGAHKEYPLMSMEETEQWILDKIDHIKRNAKHTKNQDKLVRCTDKELWKSDDVYSYYSKPETAQAGGRPQKNFKSRTEAEQHRAAKGKGVVVVTPGEPKRCEYCPAFSVCEQRKEHFPDV